MHPSLFSALLGTEEDEVLGAAAPDLETDIEVRPPEPKVAAGKFGVPASYAYKPDPTNYVETPVTGGAPAEPPKPEDVVRQRLLGTPEVEPSEPAKPSLRSLADKYGLSMEDMLPPMPRGNDASRLSSDIGRAGNTLGAALAGVKPDHSFYDNIEKRGAQDAAAMDARGDQFTKFKQALMLKVADDRTRAGKERLTFEQANALFSNDELLKPHWDKYVADSRAAGVEPNVDVFAQQAPSLRGQKGAFGRTEMGIDARNLSREDSQAHQLETMGISGDMAVAKAKFEHELKQAQEDLGAVHPNRPMLRQGIDGTTARHQRERDADAQFIIGQITDLRNKIKQHGPDVMRAVPGFRGDVMSLQQSIQSAMLRANEYGVPTGNDWKMVYNEVGNVTSFIDLVTNQADGQLQQAMKNVIDRVNAKAREAGYGDYVPGSGTSQVRPGPQAPNMRAIVGGASPAEGTPAPAEVTDMKTPWGVPFARMEEKVVGGKLKRRYLDAQGNVLKAP